MARRAINYKGQMDLSFGKKQAKKGKKRLKEKGLLLRKKEPQKPGRLG